MKNISTTIKNYIEKTASIRSRILNYLDGEETSENDSNIFKYFDELKVQEKNNFDLKKILKFLCIILNNHKKNPDFFTKSFEIILHFKEDIKKNLSNTEFYSLFSSNNKVLYHLFEKNMIKVDESIIEKIKIPSKVDYLEPVIEMYYTKQQFNDYDEEQRDKRKSGENDSYISELIRNDSVQEFIKYVNANNYSLKSKIKQCYYETNPFLQNKEPTLIEYSAFYGSIQIFRYLLQNNVKLTPSLWIYTIHSNNAELIHLLEENNVQPEGNTYDNLIIEAIKCHHNNVAIYLIDKMNQEKMKYFLDCLSYDNYELISIDPSSYSNLDLQIEQILNLIQYDSEFMNLLFAESYLDINREIRNNTLFSFAFRKHNIELIKFLLANPNIDPNIKISNEKTALMIAVEKKDMKLIELLLACANIDTNAFYTRPFTMNGEYIPEKITALTIAIDNKNYEAIQLLLQNKNINPNVYLDLSKKERTFLSMAIEKKDIKLIKLLLSCKNIDPNVIHVMEKTSERKTALSMAIEMGNEEIIQILLSSDYTYPNSKLYKNGKETTELLMAIEKGDDKITQLLLKNIKIDPCFIFTNNEYDEKTVLSMAIEKDNFELTKRLLSCPNVNIYTKLRKTIEHHKEKRNVNSILNIAIYKKNENIIRLLFNHKKRCLSK